MLALALQLQPPPQHRPGEDLAGVQLGGAPLPVPADPHAQVDHAWRLPGEVMAGLGSELAGHRLRQRPCQDRQPGALPGQHGGGGRGPVVRVAGDPGVVEDEQPAGVAVRCRRGGMGRQLIRSDLSQPAVGVVQQGDAGRAKLRAGLAEFLLPRTAQVGADLVEGGRLPVRVAQDVHRRAGRRQPVDHGAQAEALIIGVRDHRQHARPGRQLPPGTRGGWVRRHGHVHNQPPIYP